MTVLVLCTRLPPRPTLFPYTTLFRSRPPTHGLARDGGAAHIAHPSNGRRPAVPPSCALPRRCARPRSEEHTSELQSRRDLVCRLLLEKKNHCTFIGRVLDDCVCI